MQTNGVYRIWGPTSLANFYVLADTFMPLSTFVESSLKQLNRYLSLSAISESL